MLTNRRQDGTGRDSRRTVESGSASNRRHLGGPVRRYARTDDDLNDVEIALTDTDPDQLIPYLDAGWQLIPLFRYDRTSRLKNGKLRRDGKRPTHNNWTRRRYDSKEQVGHMESGSNVGVRLRADQLVIDVDPRNFAEGTDSFVELCRDVGLVPDAFPHVETGSGGSHYYMHKSPDVSVVDTLDGYPGVEFKTSGRQVVSAGSVHPDSLRVYDWDFLSPVLTATPKAPSRLMNVIRKPSRATTLGGGEYDQEEIAGMLDALDPTDFREHDTWLTLMMACHHASGGEARYEFIEWSTRDERYEADAWQIGTRWDSLSRSGSDSGAVTYKTLHKLLLDVGAGESIPRTPPEDDFDDDEPAVRRDEEEVPEHERKGPLERMNDVYCAVLEGSKFRVFCEQVDPTMDPPRRYWNRMAYYDFSMMLQNRKLQRADGKGTITVAEAWVEWGGRRSAQGIVFDPERDHEGFLNLWTGWGVKPVKGNWDLLDELLHDVLCDGNDATYQYVLDWTAHMVQRPGSPAEVALCFRGGKGVGKGTFGRALTGISGRHGMQVTSPGHLTGRFNSHLRDVILLFADEAVSPHDRDARNALKAMITEPMLAYEAKGVDVTSGKNHLHIVMASNEDWVIPTDLGAERRFLALDANTDWQGDHDRFERLHRQLRDGGLSALLWDMLNRPLGAWSPRESVPRTRAAVEQKLRGMEPVARWWFNTLSSGQPDFPFTRDDMDWDLGDVRAFKKDVRDSFRAYCRENGIRPGGSSRDLDRVFAEDLRRLMPGLDTRGFQEPVPEDREYEIKAYSNGRAWAFSFPPLDEAREAFGVLLQGPYDW